MKSSSPPRWMECMLLLILPSRDRDTVSGDLHEQYSGVKRPELGSLCADVWYARQVLSFFPSHVTAVFERSPAFILLCAFTAACGLWLGVMDLRLRHPGYEEGELVAATLVVQAALTVLALNFRKSRVLRCMSLYGAGLVTLLAVQALIATLRGSHLEGYVLLIALGLVVQACLTYIDLLTSGSHRKAG